MITKPTRKEVIEAAQRNVDAYVKQLEQIKNQEVHIQRQIDSWRNVVFLQTRDFKETPEATP